MSTVQHANIWEEHTTNFFKILVLELTFFPQKGAGNYNAASLKAQVTLTIWITDCTCLPLAHGKGTVLQMIKYFFHLYKLPSDSYTWTPNWGTYVTTGINWFSLQCCSVVLSLSSTNCLPPIKQCKILVVAMSKRRTSSLTQLWGITISECVCRLNKQMSHIGTTAHTYTYVSLVHVSEACRLSSVQLKSSSSMCRGHKMSNCLWQCDLLWSWTFSMSKPHEQFSHFDPVYCCNSPF